jgi:outer membrane biogenesis lipoprotein LolB
MLVCGLYMVLTACAAPAQHKSTSSTCKPLLQQHTTMLLLNLAKAVSGQQLHAACSS